MAFSDEWRAGVHAFWYASKGAGWRHPDNWKTRTYKCVYGMDGRPCGPSGTFTNVWPAGVHCLEDQCCSKVHISNTFSGGVCTSISGLCAIKYSSHSYAQCRCDAGKCPGDTVCVEEHFDHGGVYCKCREGMVGDGAECYEDMCKSMDCSPGKCVQEKTEVKCVCPTDYELVDNKCLPVPMCNRHIERLCGAPERVLECVNVGRTDWTCVCAPGHAVVRTEYGSKCDLASNTLFCSSKPCGTVGVDTCVDLPGGGVTCTCMKGYLLEKGDDGQHFRCTAINPCKKSPCGSDTVAKHCTRTASGSYACECQDSAELVPATDTAGPHCKHKEEEVEILPYVGVAAAGAGLVAIGLAVWWFAFRQGNITEREFDYTSEPFT